MGEMRIVQRDEGKELLDPKVLQFIALDDMEVTLAKMERRVDSYLKRREFEGKLDSKTLAATDQQQVVDLIRNDPHRPYISAFFTNDDPDFAVQIAINTPTRIHQINANETRTFDFADAEKRIELIFYKCAVGETASVRVDGQY